MLAEPQAAKLVPQLPWQFL